MWIKQGGWNSSGRRTCYIVRRLLTLRGLSWSTYGVKHLFLASVFFVVEKRWTGIVVMLFWVNGPLKGFIGLVTILAIGRRWRIFGWYCKRSIPRAPGIFKAASSPLGSRAIRLSKWRAQMTACSGTCGVLNLVLRTISWDLFAIALRVSPVSQLYTSLVISHFHRALPAIGARSSCLFRTLNVLLIALRLDFLTLSQMSASLSWACIIPQLCYFLTPHLD